MLDLDEMIESETRIVHEQVKRGMKFIKLRGRTRTIREEDINFLKGQTPEHNIFMTDCHEFSFNDAGDTRICNICKRVENLNKYDDWVPGLSSATFTTEDIFTVISNVSRKRTSDRYRQRRLENPEPDCGEC